MPTDLAQAAAAAKVDADELALRVGVDSAQARDWLASGTVPDEHRAAVEAAIGHVNDADGDDNGGTKRKKKPKSSGGRRKRSSVSNETMSAINATCEILSAGGDRQQLLAVVLDADPPDGSTSSLVNLTIAAVTANKTVREALGGIDELIRIDNPIQIGISLGSKDRRQLGVMHRVGVALIRGDVDAEELPSGDDAPLAVAAIIQKVAADAADDLRWVRELVDK